MSRMRFSSSSSVALAILVVGYLIVGYLVFLWALGTRAEAHPTTTIPSSCPQQTTPEGTTTPEDTTPEDTQDGSCPQSPTNNGGHGAVVVCVGQTGGGAIRVVVKNGDAKVYVNGTPGGSRKLAQAAGDADLEIPRPGPRFHERLRAEVEEFERDLKAEIRANTDGGAFSGACETAPFEEE